MENAMRKGYRKLPLPSLQGAHPILPEAFARNFDK